MCVQAYVAEIGPNVQTCLPFQLSTTPLGCEHCCRLQAIYSLITGKNFVTAYTAFDP